MRWLLVFGVLAAAVPAAADPGVATTGTTGFLTLPAAQPHGVGAFAISSDLGLGYDSAGAFFGPGSLAVGLGLPPAMDISLSMRETGLARDLPGDAGLLRMALKVNLFPGDAHSPALALELAGDDLADAVVPAGRVLVSSTRSGGVMVGAALGYHGNRWDVSAGPDVGAAISWESQPRLEWLGDISVEGLAPWSLFLGGGMRYRILPRVSITTSINWGVLGPAGVRLMVAMSIHSKEGATAQVTQAAPDEPPDSGDAEKRFTTERPRFRMRVPPLKLPSERGYSPLQPEPIQESAPQGQGGSS